MTILNPSTFPTFVMSAPPRAPRLPWDRSPSSASASASASASPHPPIISPLRSASSVADDSLPPTPAIVFALDDSQGGSDDEHAIHYRYLNTGIRPHNQRQPLPNSDASSLMSSSFASRWSNASGFPDISIDSTRGGTLLGGLPSSGHHHDAAFTSASIGVDGDGSIPSYPRRLWSVSDTKVARYPNAWPRPAHAVDVTRTAPAVIAIRIASCLALRSVAADYDDEAATAYCVTIDQCHFVVHLWRRSKPSRGDRCTQAFSAAVLAYDDDSVMVECVRIRGSAETFHRTAVAIFDAAQALDSGADRRHLRQTGPAEYPRLLKRAKLSRDTKVLTDDCTMQSILGPVSTNDEIVALDAIELAFSFLGKDRWDAQSWGMYSLVALVDSSVTKKKVAICAASALLGNASPLKATILPQLQSGWIFDVIVTRQLPNEKRESVQVAAVASARIPARNEIGRLSLGGSRDSDEGKSSGEDAENQSATFDRNGVGELLDDEHAGQMRLLTLRMFTTALQLLADEDPSALRAILSASSQPLDACWITSPFISALFTDLQGASRPACLSGGRWPTSHEATLAAKCLGLLSQHSDRANAIMKYDSDLLLHLEKATGIGRSAHAALATEARQTYLLLTEEDRSC